MLYFFNKAYSGRVPDSPNTFVTKLRRSSHFTRTILRNSETTHRRGTLGKTILFKSQSGDVLGRSRKLQVNLLQMVLLLAHRTDRHQSEAGLGGTYYHPRKRVRVQVRVKRVLQHPCGNHHLGDLHQRFFLCPQKLDHLLKLGHRSHQHHRFVCPSNLCNPLRNRGPLHQ